MTNYAPIPALLAIAGVHHHLIREGTRTQVSLVLESGEPREVHHFALLIGYGAGAINPYLAFETLEDMVRQGHLMPHSPLRGRGVGGEGELAEKAIHNYVKAIEKGVLKVMSKMGISTAHSYCGAQIFEAIGLSDDIIDQYFTGTPSRVGGIGMDVIAEEVLARYDHAFTERPTNGRTLDVGGHYQFRKEGEYHLFNPETVHKLQYACRSGNFKVFREYSKLVDDQSTRLCTLRGLMSFKLEGRKSVPIESVEPVEAIMKRFKSGAMSYGSISQEAHETMADRHEPHRRQEQHRRRGRGPVPLSLDQRARRFQEQRHQAGRVGPVRRHQRIPGDGQGIADQDGAGGETGRRRPTSGAQGLSLDRQGAALDAGRRPDLAAAAPRHLFHRGFGRADPRSEERQRERAHSA